MSGSCYPAFFFSHFSFVLEFSYQPRFHWFDVDEWWHTDREARLPVISHAEMSAFSPLPCQHAYCHAFTTACCRRCCAFPPHSLRHIAWVRWEEEGESIIYCYCYFSSFFFFFFHAFYATHTMRRDTETQLISQERMPVFFCLPSTENYASLNIYNGITDS